MDGDDEENADDYDDGDADYNKYSIDWYKVFVLNNHLDDLTFSWQEIDISILLVYYHIKF